MSTITPFPRAEHTPELALAEWTRTLKRSMLREMLAVVARPGILSFAGGLPAPELFPTADFAAATAKVLATDDRALQYGPPFPPLKNQIVDLMASRGVTVTADQVFITTGAQQALNVLARLFLDPGAPVILEELVYSGILQAIAPSQPQILSVPTDLTEGIDVEAVEDYLLAGHRPAFLYTIPVAHNPLGVNISPAGRESLVELARRYGLPIIEDDPYGFLRYDGPPLRPLRALDDEWIFYVGSFSKILAPALRLGWMIVPDSLLGKLTVIKESYDLETSAFIQRAVAAYLAGGSLPAHLERLRSAYRQRRDTMLAALKRYFPASAHWSRPDAGMFIWVELPGHVDTSALLPQAVDEIQVAYIPGSAFSATGGSRTAHGQPDAHNCLRLNFSNAACDQIEDGLARLGGFLRNYC